MVPVSVGEDKMEFFSFFIDQLVAQFAYTGSGINDDDIITFCPDLDTGGITAILEILFSGNRMTGESPAFHIACGVLAGTSNESPA